MIFNCCLGESDYWCLCNLALRPVLNTGRERVVEPGHWTCFDPFRLTANTGHVLVSVGEWSKSRIGHCGCLTCQDIQLICHFGRKHFLLGFIEMFLGKLTSWKVVNTFVRSLSWREQLMRNREPTEGWLCILGLGFLSFPRMSPCSSCPLLLDFSESYFYCERNVKCPSWCVSPCSVFLFCFLRFLPFFFSPSGLIFSTLVFVSSFVLLSQLAGALAWK